MTGHGGWPLNAFLTPDGVPFYAGTYFPPEPRQGMPSWRQVLEGVARRVGRAARRDRRAAPSGSSPRLQARRSSQAPDAELDPGVARRRRRRRCGAATTPSTAAGAARRSSRRRRRSSSCSRRGEREMALQTLRRMAARRHLRPGRRRLRALLGRRALARPALREDALRQRAARARVPARLPGLRRAAASSACASETLDWALRELRQDGGRLRVARSTPTPRASRASSTSGRSTRCARRSAPTWPTAAIAHFGVTEARQLRGREHPRARDARPASGSPRSRPACSRRASSASGPGSTTSA